MTTAVADETQFELSEEQVRFYEENGYLAPLRLRDDRQLQEMRHRLETMIRDDYSRADELVSPPRVKPGEKPRMIYFQGAWRVDDLFRDLVFLPRLTTALCQLLGTESV